MKPKILSVSDNFINDKCCNDLNLDEDINPDEILIKSLQKNTQKFYRSELLKSFIESQLKNSKVDGLDDVTVFDIVNEIVSRKDNEGKNYRCYIFGGLIRDYISEKSINPDIDFLFTIPVPELHLMCKEKRWLHYYKLKEDNLKRRSDFIQIGKKPEPFTGHFFGGGCDGDFSMNCLYYDIGSNVLVDITGRGVKDSINRIISLPSDYESWMNEDRLKGMKLFRFFNFIGKGFRSDSEELTSMIIKDMIYGVESGDYIVSLRVFLKRKIIVSNLELSEKKESNFRRSFLEQYKLIHNKDGEHWYLDKIVPEMNNIRSEKVSEKIKNAQVIFDKLELRRRTLLETGSMCIILNEKN